MATRTVAEATAEAREALAAMAGKPALYHCVSRVVWRELVLGAPEKEKLVSLLRKWEAFSQVRVLAYCIMANHFHLLVEVPERPGKEPTEDELLQYLGLIYDGEKLQEIRAELEQCRAQKNRAAVEALRERYLRRMWDLSAFMKNLKQDFSKWYNKRHGKRGNLWEQRFKSVLVEDGHAAQVVSAYIDLNPVRAGVVAKAEAYRWSGWGEAVAGGREAREAVRRVMRERAPVGSDEKAGSGEVAPWRTVVATYRHMLEGGGQGDADRKAGRKPAAPEGTAAGQPAKPAARRRGRPPKGAELAAMSEAEMVRGRVRYFEDGMVVGSAEFVDGVFSLSRKWFGERRTSGARKLAQANTPLRSMRALKVAPYGTDSPPA